MPRILSPESRTLGSRPQNAEYSLGPAKRSTAPISSVAPETVAATLPHLPPTVDDMVRVQRLTGCRPSEICNIRWCDIDRSDDVWIYTPFEHKTEHKKKARRIAIPQIVGQYYGFFIVVLGAIWAFFGVRGGGAEGNVDGKTMPFRIEWRAFGISAVLALCGTFILIFCLWREIEVSRYSTSPQAKSSFVLPRPSGKIPDNIAEIMQYERDNPPGKSAAPSE